MCLSYSDEDGAFASRLRRDLRESGLAVWDVRWHSSSSSSLGMIIEQGLDAAHVTVLVLSPDHCGPVPPIPTEPRVVDGPPRVVLALHRDCKVPEGLRTAPSIDFRNASSYDAALRALKALLPDHLEEEASVVASRRMVWNGLSISLWLTAAAVTLLRGEDWLLSPVLAVVASIVTIAGVQLGTSQGWRAPAVGAVVFGVGAPLLMWTYRLVYDQSWREAFVVGWAFIAPVALCAWVLSYAGGRIEARWALAFLGGVAVLLLQPIAWLSAFMTYCLTFGCF